MLSTVPRRGYPGHVPPARKRRNQFRNPTREPDPFLHLANEVTKLRMAVTLARNELRQGKVSIAQAILDDADAPTVPSSRKPRSPFA